MSFRPQSPAPAKGANAGERIAKLLARAGIASRREVERMIEEGRVAVNGVAISTPATILTSLDGVTVDGNPVAAVEAARLFLYHKPVGLLVTERDPKGRPTIYDRLPPDLPRVVPVGRLDLATEGLLLLTTDGGLKRQLELPATGVERSYRARTYGRVTQEQLEDLMLGIEIEGIRYGQIDANLERRTGANAWIELTLKEGKNREVRRVLEHLGLQVSRLIRTRYGPFVLGDLPPGAVGEIRAHDIDSFRANPTRLDLPQPTRRRGAEAEPDMRVMRAPRSSPLTGRGTVGRQADGGAGPARSTASAARPLHRPANGLPPRAGEDRKKGPSLGRGSAKPRTEAPAEAAKPQRAKRAAAHRQATGRDAPPPPPRNGPPVRKKGWARPKPKSGPGGPRKK
ncbi:MAG: pseudouridine synthase [Pseudomonadota bacterium]